MNIAKLNRRRSSVFGLRHVAALLVGLGAVQCKKAEPTYEPYPDQVAHDTKQKEMLASYSVTNQDKGLYQVPVDVALDLVASDADLLDPVVKLKSLEEMNEVERGQYHFQNTYACAACHGFEGEKKVGPALNARWGKAALLEGGEEVVFNDEYFKESVLYSTKKIARGYQPVMPVFAGQMTDEHLAEITAYIKTYQ